MSQRAVFVVLPVVLRMEGRDARERGGRLGLGEIFVALETDGDADLRFSLRGIRGGRPDDPQNVTAAAYGHAFAKSNFGRHAEREFDLGAFGQRRVGEEEHSPRTEILGKSNSFNRSSRLTERERKKVREPLSDTAFNANWRNGHSA
jgi:hypothetical protein